MSSPRSRLLRAQYKILVLRVLPEGVRGRPGHVLQGFLPRLRGVDHRPCLLLEFVLEVEQRARHCLYRGGLPLPESIRPNAKTLIVSAHEGFRHSLTRPTSEADSAARPMIAGKSTGGVMDRMGHAQIQTTQKYLHALPDTDQKNLDALTRMTGRSDRMS
jgi:integrase